jgi:3-oxoacyl-[acyl-carrier protein] reductase
LAPEPQNGEFERVVIVTGAASGIGAAIARRLAGPGTALILHTRRNEDGLIAVGTDVRAAGAGVAFDLRDLAEEGAGARLVEATVAAFGRVDQIVSNAGFADKRRFGDFDLEDYRASNATITEAFFEMTSAAMPYLTASEWGRVVAISSFVAHTFGANDVIFPSTAAAKGAVEALAKALAYQLAPSGVCVNCVAPGYTQKDPGAHQGISEEGRRLAAELAPMKTLVAPDDVAATVQFLLSQDAARITGQVIHVDAGLGLL